MDRDRVWALIQAAYAARMAGDGAAVEAMCAPDAKFEVVGAKTHLRHYPAAGPLAMRPAVEEILKVVRMTDARPVSVLIDGNKAAVRIRATVSLGGREPLETDLCHLWEFDGEGRIVALAEFLDTALLQSEMAELQVQ